MREEQERELANRLAPIFKGVCENVFFGSSSNTTSPFQELLQEVHRYALEQKK